MEIITERLQRWLRDMAATGFTDETVLACLVAPGEVLVSTATSPAGRVVAGENVFRETSGELHAQVHGYPALRMENGTEGSTALLSVAPLIRIEDDGMAARLFLYPAADGCALPDPAAIAAIVEASGVTYGYDRGEVARCLADLQESGTAQLARLVARGSVPVAGEDAWLRLEVEVGAMPGKVLGDGSIDFRERRMFVSVKKDELIAVKVPRTLGTPGKNVRGETIPASEGKDITVKVADLAVFNEQDGSIRATAPGILSVTNETNIRVSAKQQISGDIDYSTGNIRFHGNVEIGGSVQPGFVVASRGDIHIGGDVQSAKINSHGNVVIAGGVVGEESAIHAQGDVDVKYIERGLVVSGGTIVVRSSAYYSDLQASGDICGGEQSRIIGGSAFASGSVTMGAIGSSGSDATTIAVGIDLRRYRFYLDLQERHGRLIEELQRSFLHRGKRAGSEEAIAELNDEIASIERQLSVLNLVLGSPEDSLGDRNHFHTSAEIRVSGDIKAGVIVRIGNEVLTVKNDCSHSRVCLHPVTGGIIFQPL